MNTITCKQIYTLKNVNCDIKNIKYVEKSKNLELLYVIKDKLLLAHDRLLVYYKTFYAW